MHVIMCVRLRVGVDVQCEVCACVLAYSMRVLARARVCA